MLNSPHHPLEKLTQYKWRLYRSQRFEVGGKTIASHFLHLRPRNSSTKLQKKYEYE